MNNEETLEKIKTNTSTEDYNKNIHLLKSNKINDENVDIFLYCLREKANIENAIIATELILNLMKRRNMTLNDIHDIRTDLHHINFHIENPNPTK